MEQEMKLWEVEVECQSHINERDTLAVGGESLKEAYDKAIEFMNKREAKTPPTVAIHNQLIVRIEYYGTVDAK